MKIPSLILKQLYNFNSLKNLEGAVQLSLKNRLSETALTGVTRVVIDGTEQPLDHVTLHIDNRSLAAAEITADSPLPFPLGQTVDLRAAGPRLDDGRHEIALEFETENFGKLSFKVKDGLSKKEERVQVPYDKEHDYEESTIRRRQDFVSSFSGAKLDHVTKFSFDPEETRGNIENFTGVAQVPIGFAGPLKVNGEHAQGEFLIPLATTEGTLVASYNRGIKVLNLSGGVRCTVVDDAMQRAPVFVFESAREARDFRKWVEENIDAIRNEAEATSSVAKLTYIDPFLANKFAFLRFNYSTGDAAGQNMVGRATFAACSWILEHVDTIKRFYLESNLATDKKASQVNVMRTRGKRVTAEVTVPRDVLEQNMRVRAGEPRLPLPGGQRRRHPLRRQQQRPALGQRHHGDVHRHRAGRGQRLRVVGGHPLRRDDPRGRSVHLDHDPVADRGHLRRRHRAAHPARVPRGAGLRRQGQGAQVRRDHRRRRAGRRDLAGLGDLVPRLGVEPRGVRAQPLGKARRVRARPADA